jgi:hypothetical protein
MIDVWCLQQMIKIQSILKIQQMPKNLITFLFITDEDVVRGEETLAELSLRVSAYPTEIIASYHVTKDLEFVEITNQQWLFYGKVLIVEKNLRLSEIKSLIVEWWVDEY